MMSGLGSNAHPHRTNPDGTFDSICPICFNTVGTSKKESDLEALEAQHVCDAVRAQEYDSLLRPGVKRKPKGSLDR